MAVLVGLWVGGRIAYALYADHAASTNNAPIITTNVTHSFSMQNDPLSLEPEGTIFSPTTKPAESQIAYHIKSSKASRHAQVMTKTRQGNTGQGFAARHIAHNEVSEARNDLSDVPTQGPSQDQHRDYINLKNWPQIQSATNAAEISAQPVHSKSTEPHQLNWVSATKNFSLSGSTWLLWRRSQGQTALASNGQLAGSQAGAKLTLQPGGKSRLPKPFAFARITSPLRSAMGKEGAVGIGFRANGTAPLEIALERRHKLDKGGQSAWALGMSGGFYELPATGRWRASGYAQIGFVGARSRNIYVEGASEVTRKVAGKIEAGMGLWASNQPRLHRLDTGPLISMPIPIGHTKMRLSGQWRFRLAGNAKPDSGPAVTLGADF